MNFLFAMFFFSLFIYSIKLNLKIGKIMFWILFAIISLIGAVISMKIPRAKINYGGLWTGDLFMNKKDIKRKKSFFIPWTDIKKIILKQKDIEAFKKAENFMLKNMISTTIHIPISVETKNEKYQILIHNYSSFINTLKKMRRNIVIK